MRGSLAAWPALLLWALAPGSPVRGAAQQLGRPPTKSRRRCLLADTDVDFDDAMALVYSCMADAGDLRAITVTGNGFSLSAERGAATVRRLLRLCRGAEGAAGGGGHPAVAAGRNLPLANTSFHFPFEWREQAQRFFDAALPPLHSGPAEAGGAAADAPATRVRESSSRGRHGEKGAASPAAQLIVETATACLEEGRLLDIVAMAPLTNVAEALRLEPDLLRRALGGVYFSGGNIGALLGNDADCGGTRNTAECNIFLDAVAAQEVLAAGVNVRVMDTASSAALPVPSGLAQELARGVDPAARAAPLQRFFAGALTSFLASATHQLYFYDPAAMVWRHQEAAAERKQRRKHEKDVARLPLCKAERELTVDVDLKDSLTYGTLLREKGSGLSVDFCWKPDQQRFLADFLGPLFGRSAAVHGGSLAELPGLAAGSGAAAAAAVAAGLAAAGLLGAVERGRRWRRERPALGSPLLA